MTSRELVYKTLNFENYGRAPRQLWVLPWAVNHHKEELEKIIKDNPDDIIFVSGFNTEQDISSGNPYEIGESVDGWGCHFINYQRGIIGEVKKPIVKDDDWEDISAVHIPTEWQSIDKDKINEFCRNTDKFVIAGACPRPFEQLQFIRGTENLYMDLMMMPKGLVNFMEKMHRFYCELLYNWAETDVDALMFMDDWGAQNSLLIDPKLWVELFKPMYKEYIDIAHLHNKKIFMHSDGYIVDIFPHLIEMGLDAINSQVFCMTPEKLKPFKGKITFWGEMDRQNLLPKGTVEEIEQAVIRLKKNLHKNGGCIAQCEFGPGARPENVAQVYAAWGNLL